MNTKEEVKALWKLCFDDTDEFVNLYFERRYKDEINLSAREDGRLVAALQMIPYPITFCGEVVDVSYISGACTHPDYRGRGIMRGLLADAHRHMYRKDILLSTLIPAKQWLFEFYGQSGYAPTFGYVNQPIELCGLHPASDCVVVDETDNRHLLFERYHYFSSMMKKRPCCIQHPREDFLIILEDLRLSSGKMLVARRSHHIVGMAFCVPQDGGVVVKELLADDERVRDSLLLESARLFQADAVNCLQPSFLDSFYLGMARVIHAERVLCLIARKYPGLDMSIHLHGDEVVPENNGYYTLSGGRCLRGWQPDVDYRPCNIRDFTRLLLTAEHPYMSLMLD